MDAPQQWGVQLIGHPFDLADWADCLKPPFDPWVIQDNEACVLRWSGFDGLETASDVQANAAPVVDQLNAAMWIDRQTRAVRFEGIISFRPDGTRDTIMLAGVGGIEIRGRAAAVGIAIGPYGGPLPPPIPKPNNVQEWVRLAEKHPLLADALIYFTRAEWFDIYKAVECLEDWVGAGESGLRDLNWIEKEDFKRLKRTANSFRHRRGGTHSPPERPMALTDAREMLAALVRSAFKQAGSS